MRMRDLFLVILAFAGAIWTYQIKHEAENSARTLRDLRSEIRIQDNKIVLLQADWAIMTDPRRLSRLARDYSTDLQLRPTQTSQIIDTSILPPLASPARSITDILTFSESNQ